MAREVLNKSSGKQMHAARGFVQRFPTRRETLAEIRQGGAAQLVGAS